MFGSCLRQVWEILTSWDTTTSNHDSNCSGAVFDIYKLRIPVTTGGFELRISHILSRYLIARPECLIGWADSEYLIWLPDPS